MSTISVASRDLSRTVSSNVSRRNPALRSRVEFTSTGLILSVLKNNGCLADLRKTSRSSFCCMSISPSLSMAR